MNWDRRAFVKFAVGAVVGLHASPLVPKLMDDSAIWTQNWSWVPNPEGGALAFANSVNPATGTGVRLQLVDSRIQGERVIRVEGNPEHPASQGGVLPADASAAQLLYNDEVRVNAPLLLDKHTGMYKEISWDEALALLGGKLSELAKAGKSQAVVALGAEPGSVNGEILSRFMAAYGSPNLAFPPSAEDTLALAGWALFGQTDLGFDLAHAKYVISFGTPLLEGFGSPVAVRKAFTAWKDNKGVLVQVEPRASVTASQADTWLACKPGAEALVALAMCQVLVEKGLVDEAAANALGFADGERGAGFKTLLNKEYAPAKVAEACGVPADKITAIALAFAKAPQALAVCGPGPGGDPGRLFDFMAVLALNALKGNLGKQGGLVARKPLGLKPLGEAMSANGKPRLAPQGPFKVNDPLALAKAGLAGKPYKPELVLVAGGNPAYGGPQASLMTEFLRSAPMVVAITPFMDETASLAQLILPATTFLDGWGDCLSPYGSAANCYGVHRPLVRPYPQAKPAGEVLLMLAAKLGGEVAKALPFASLEDALKARVNGLGGLADMAKKGYFMPDKPAYGAMAMKTPSGKLEFYSQNLANQLAKAGEGKAMLAGLGVHAEGAAAFMPHYEKPAALGGHGHGHGNLVLAALPSLRSGVGAQPTTPHMLKLQGNDSLVKRSDLVVEMNPSTAAHLHLHAGDLVEVASKAGSVQARVRLFAGAAPGVVFMPTGLGHWAIKDTYTLNKGGNFNRVAEATPDPMSGIPQWGLTRVTVIHRG